MSLIEHSVSTKSDDYGLEVSRFMVSENIVRIGACMLIFSSTMRLANLREHYLVQRMRIESRKKELCWVS